MRIPHMDDKKSSSNQPDEDDDDTLSNPFISENAAKAAIGTLRCFAEQHTNGEPFFDIIAQTEKKQQKNTLAELLPGPSPPPPAAATTASSMVALNPFDDPIPSNNSGKIHNKTPSQPSHLPQSQAGPLPPAQGSVMHAKIYPPNQPMVFNPSNPSAPPIYPCGVCHKEVHENEQAVLCESGCNFWFHRACTGLTSDAFTLLKAEVYAEWVCDRCLNTKNIPLVKLKP